MNAVSRYAGPYVRQRAAWSTAALGILALSLAACAGQAESANSNDGIVYGEAVELGNGLIRTYVRLEGETPVEVGVAMNEGALGGLPADGAPGGMMMPDGHSTFEIVLAMPDGHGTPFRHSLVGWNPAGHEPPGIYNLPHFDFHFYTIEPHERHRIDPADPEFLRKGTRALEASHLPAGFILPEGLPPVPFMGAHWLDPTSPELRDPPETFTHTFIYGSWDGRLIFAEPMVTKAFIESRTAVRVPIGVAERYDPAGYYPGAYEVRWDEAAAEYRVALTELAWRD